jgi:hypothetical protein
MELKNKKTCPNCFKDFVVLANQGIRIYCSLACRSEFYSKKYYFERELLGKKSKKNCTICGQEFLVNKGSKTCSLACSQVLRRQSVRKAADKYYEVKRRIRVKPVSFNVKKEQKISCLKCDRKIPFGRKKTCSLVCKNKRNYQTHKEIKQKRLLAQGQGMALLRNCAECDQQFERKGPKITCSLPCWKKTRDRKALIARQKRLGIKYFSCVSCAKEFKREGSENVCSSECRRQMKRKTAREWYKSNASCCRFCQKKFERKTNASFCSPECRDNYKKLKYVRNKQRINRKLTEFINCVNCGKLSRKKTNSLACSDECRRINNKAVRLKYEESKRKWREKHSQPRKVWFSIKKINCFHCGTSFQITSPTQKYCSLNCKKSVTSKNLGLSSQTSHTHTHTHKRINEHKFGGIKHG